MHGVNERSVFIKICGLRHIADIRAAREAGASAFGIVLAESPRRVGIDDARDLLNRAPDGISSYCVTKHPPAALADACAALPFARFQSDHTDFMTTLSEIPPDRRVPVVRMLEDFEATLELVLSGSATEGSAPGMVVVEGARSGAGEQVDWARVRAFASSGKILLAGGLNASNVRCAIRESGVTAVDVSSGVETTPGVKDPGMIREFVEAAMDADTREPGDTHG